MRGTRSKSVTPINAHLPMEPVSNKVLLRDLLTGACSKEALRLCRTEDLEHLLFKIIGMHSATLEHTDSIAEVKPSWWLDDVLPFSDLENVRSKVHDVMQKWHNTLTKVLDTCVQYYRKTKPKPFRADISQASMSSPGTSTSESPPRKRRRMNSDNEIDLARSPVVLLQDVLRSRYPVLEKYDFMNFLSLQPIGTLPAAPVTKSLRNRRCYYYTKIPFSSNYGKKAIANSRYICSKESYQRKQDWMNRYLVNGDDGIVQTSKKRYEVTYKPKKSVSTCERRFTFPRRQQRQRKNAQDAFRKAFFKPVTVRLKRLNIQPYLMKMKMCRRVCVNVDKTETDKHASRMLSTSTTY